MLYIPPISNEMSYAKFFCEENNKVDHWSHKDLPRLIHALFGLRMVQATKQD